MPTRTLTGTITRPDGTPFTGTLRVTPLEQIVVGGSNVAVMPVDFAVTAGALPVGAAIVVPGTYEFTLIDGTAELQCFQAYVPAGTTSLSLFDIYTAAYSAPPVPSGPMYLVAGSSVLLLAPGGGTDGEFLQRMGGVLVWSTLPVPPPLPAPVPYVFGISATGFAVTGAHTPTAPLEFNNASGNGDGRMTMDLTDAAQIRLNLVVAGTTEPSGAVATAQYSTDGGSNWNYFHAAALNAPLDTVGHRLTGWVNLPPAARADVQVRIVGHSGGSGTACSVGMVKVDVR